MYALILTLDRQIEFAQLVIQSYSKLWPTSTFIYRVPYNREYPRVLAQQPNIELIQTGEGIKSTMFSLLNGIEDDEFVYWAIDDRYPVRIRNTRILDRIQAFISADRTNIDAVKLISLDANLCDEGSRIVLGGIRFRWQTKFLANGFYMHHFVRARILRNFFLDFELPDNYSIREFHERLLETGIGNRLLVPRNSLIRFGETSRNGKITLNGLYDLKRYQIKIPDLVHTNKIVIYGNHGEVIEPWRYKIARIYKKASWHLKRTDCAL